MRGKLQFQIGNLKKAQIVVSPHFSQALCRRLKTAE